MSRREDRGEGGNRNRRRKSGNKKLHRVTNYFLQVDANYLIFKPEKLLMKACLGRCEVLP
jgi:hypothetical protein